MVAFPEVYPRFLYPYSSDNSDFHTSGAFCRQEQLRITSVQMFKILKLIFKVTPHIIIVPTDIVTTYKTINFVDIDLYSELHICPVFAFYYWTNKWLVDIHNMITELVCLAVVHIHLLIVFSLSKMHFLPLFPW